MLEILDKGQTTAAHPVPILFVHGGCHGAWCWDEHFLDFFTPGIVSASSQMDTGYYAFQQGPVYIDFDGTGTTSFDYL